MTLEIAAAHVHAEDHVVRRALDHVVDVLDVATDQAVRLLARGFDLLTDRGIAQQRDRDLVELDVAAAGLDQSRDLLAEDPRQVGEESFDVRVGVAAREIGAAVEMHRRRRRQRDLRRRLGDAAQELELVERQRLLALQLAFRVGRRECHLVAVIVAEVEHRGLDREAVDALDEPAPIRAAAEFAVGHDLQADVLLHADDVADALVLNLGEARIVELSRHDGRGTLDASAGGRNRLPTWSARNGGRPGCAIAAFPARIEIVFL